MHPVTPAREVAVTLKYQPLGELQVSRRNLRLDGLFVDTGAVTLPHQCEVEVTLAFRHDDDELEVHTLHARVMGRSRHGTNLTFQDCRRETYRALQEVMTHVQD
jgi:hypothetical protein